MPKEYGHWFVAQRAASRLPPGPLADAVRSSPEFFFAGAVSHDSGYYRLHPRAKAAADRLHGVGADSWEPFRRLWAHRDGGEPVLAFGFGALTHVAVDTVFHPWVYSWTGAATAENPRIRQGWVYRHLAMEAALDQHFEALWGTPPVRTLRSLLHRGRPLLLTVHQIFSGPGAPPSLTAHGSFQIGWAQPVLGAVARVATMVDRGGETDWSGGFYRGRPRISSLFQGPLEWIDPVLGTPHQSTLDELVDLAVDRALTWGDRWERGWTPPQEPFSQTVGPGLDTGVPGDQGQLQRFFSPQASTVRWI